MSAANRRRGHDCERAVVSYLKANGFPDACTTRAKLGHDGAKAPGDIDFHPLIVLEVKDVKGSSWPSWCRQAAAQAPQGTVPVVVRRTRGVTDVGLWECRILEEAWAWFASEVPVPCFNHDWVVDGSHWCTTTFEDLAADVRALDAEGAA